MASLIQDLIRDCGPFAPVVGYGVAITNSAAALLFAWGGKSKKWLPPEEDLPGTARSIVLLLCGVLMLVLWYFATPSNFHLFLWVAPVLAVLYLLCYLSYNGMIGTYVYIKRVATGPNSTRDIRILGGRKLLPEAEKKRKKEGVDIQTLFEGAEYKPDLLWAREEREWVKKRVLALFILTLFLGTSALTGAGFAAQVFLSGKPAASIIRATDAPGLQEQNTQSKHAVESKQKYSNKGGR